MGASSAIGCFHLLLDLQGTLLRHSRGMFHRFQALFRVSVFEF